MDIFHPVPRELAVARDVLVPGAHEAHSSTDRLFDADARTVDRSNVDGHLYSGAAFRSRFTTVATADRLTRIYAEAKAEVWS